MSGSPGPTPTASGPRRTIHRLKECPELGDHLPAETEPLISPGVGKTHLAVALAVAACRAGYSIYFTSLDDMVRNLKAAEDQGRLMSKLTSYLRPAVLVVDEVGYQPLERAEANLVFQCISKRYEKGSIILTSNKTFGEWGQVFGDEVLATAILDRLLHHCEVVSINGNSYRLKNRLQPSNGRPMWPEQWHTQLRTRWCTQTSKRTPGATDRSVTRHGSADGCHHGRRRRRCPC